MSSIDNVFPSDLSVPRREFKLPGTVVWSQELQATAHDENMLYMRTVAEQVVNVKVDTEMKGRSEHSELLHPKRREH